MNSGHKYNIILLIWAGLSTILLIRLYINQSSESYSTIEELNHKIDSVSALNIKLDSLMKTERNKAFEIEWQIDSIKNIEPKIKTLYVNKYKEIDNANVGIIVDKFDSLFTKNNVK